ncbi:hypothetical protein BDY19DRAFT_964785 [Irpex rosettiformis]|uniref:Uncharacterized protein n=1 Tax=Irpex rosettiformis TaxID=378272 RepID=A0ACB8TUA0_9APHY|nr:hypothetical protein BDY19DRAFT_964785 [Irpex rosettiformis]
MAPKKERDEALNDFTARIFSGLLEEVLMDVVLQSHQETARFNAVCDICHTRCNSDHISDSSTGGTPSSSQLNQPNGQTLTVDPAALSGNGSGSTNGNGFTYFDCNVCGRAIASNRFAPHLSSCMGLGNSRRGAVRTSTSKARLEAGRSASPYLGSDLGALSDDGKPPPKGKGKSRAKQADDAEFSLHRKRNGSPSPSKKSKKAKTGLSSAPPLSQTSSQSRIPSKLRESSVISSAIQGQRSNSPDSMISSPAMSASTPSAFSIQSPVLAGAGIPGRPTLTRNGNGLGSASSVRFSPQPPPPIVVRSVEEYFVDVEGDETGSSTDSDSD